MWSGLPDLPQGAISLSGGYALLHPYEESLSKIRDDEHKALQEFVVSQSLGDTPLHISRCGRIQLPNGQRVRCAWREDERKREPRVSRMVKVCTLQYKYLFYFTEHITAQGLRPTTPYTPNRRSPILLPNKRFSIWHHKNVCNDFINIWFRPTSSG